MPTSRSNHLPEGGRDARGRPALPRDAGTGLAAPTAGGAPAQGPPPVTRTAPRAENGGPKPAPAPAGRGGASGAWGGVPGLVLVSVLMLYPLAALLVQVALPHLFDLRPSLRIDFGPALQVFAARASTVAIANSLVIGACAAFVAALAGTLTACGAFRAPRVLRGLIEGCVWGVFLAPSYVIAEGWLTLLQGGGIAAMLLHLGNGWSAWFFTRYGLAAVMGLRYFPFVHLAVYEGLSNIGEELVQAGRLLGAGRRRVLLSIILPLLAPAVLAGASIAFAEGVGDFGLAAAIAPQMHLPLLPYQIYVALGQAPVNYSAAAGLSLVEILLTAGALLLQFLWLRRRSYHTVSAASRVGGTTAGPTPAAVAALLVAAAALALPVGATLVGSLWKAWSEGFAATNWTLANYRAAMSAGTGEAAALARSLVYALIAGVVAMTAGLYVAHAATARRSRVGAALSLITVSTIAVPGVVLAAGFVFAWNARWLIPLHLVLYGTPVCLGMAYVAGSLPYAVRLQIGAISQLSPNLTTAARSLGASSLRILREIVFPLVRGMALATFFMTFCGTMFELPASALLYPPGAPPFPVEIQSLFSAFEWAAGSALAISGMVIVFGTYLLGRLLTRGASPGPAARAAVAPARTAAADL